MVLSHNKAMRNLFDKHEKKGVRKFVNFFFGLWGGTFKVGRRLFILFYFLFWQTIEKKKKLVW